MSKAILQLQLTAEQTWVAYWQAVVNTGAYKFRKSERVKGSKPDGSFEWRPSTDEEKLQDAMGSLHAHAERVQDLVNLLIEEENEEG